MSTIEKRISTLVPTQFPAFYHDDGPLFVAFTKAYYEWMEEENNTLYKARRLGEYSNIDLTPESFLQHFQKKYLYGIPFDVIINKRLLLKHVLDAYRSKGSLQCYRLLFRLIYNENMDRYLPGEDVIRSSDGTWKQPKYLEVSDSTINHSYVGKQIIGFSSLTTAIVEKYVKEYINGNEICSSYISNVFPKSGDFVKGEKIIPYTSFGSNEQDSAILQAPFIKGSLFSLELIEPGDTFAVGDVLKINEFDINTNERITSGQDGIIKVKKVTRGRGQLAFSIINGGFGHRTDSLTFSFNHPSDNTGVSGSFNVGTLSNASELSYNTDLIVDYLDTTFNDVALGFPLYPDGSADNLLLEVLSYSNGIFGTISSLANIHPGNNYTGAVTNFVKTPIISQQFSGNVVYTTASPNVVGTSTSFSTFFQNNDLVVLQSNSSDSSTLEYHIVKQIVNNTVMVLYKKPSKNSTSTAIYKLGVDTVSSNWPIETDSLFVGMPELNANISGVPSIGNGVVSEIEVLQSGKGYLEGSVIEAYKFGSVESITIVSAGTGYANGDPLIFYNEEPIKLAAGHVSTNSTGSIVSTVISNKGAGFGSAPSIRVKSTSGNGAILECIINNIDENSKITGKVLKSGIGKSKGYWSTTRGFLNSDKFLHDSYYYQDYSYEIQTPISLNKYKELLYNTFHPAGTEMFGKYLDLTTLQCLYGNNYLASNLITLDPEMLDITSDSDQFTADSLLIIIDSTSFVF